MTQGELLSVAPANIIFPSRLDVGRVAKEIGEAMLAAFEIPLAGLHVTALTDPRTGLMHSGSLSVTATGTDGMTVSHFSARQEGPHHPAAASLLEQAARQDLAFWDDDRVNYTLTLQDAPTLPGVFRH